MSADFAATLRRYRVRAGFSQNALAKVVGIDASYINRLESGEREAPTRPVAQSLARALARCPEEVDRLLFSAGHMPPSLQKLGPADPTIAAVTRLLTNDRLSPETRADFRAVVETIAIRWQSSLPALAPVAERCVRRERWLAPQRHVSGVTPERAVRPAGMAIGGR